MLSVTGRDVGNDGAVLRGRGGVVAGRVEVEAEAAGVVDNGGAQVGAALADAAREDQGVDGAAEGDVVGADVAADAVDKEVEGQAAEGRAVGAGGSSSSHGGEVCGAREGAPAGFFVEDLLGAGDVEVLRR